jgi:hypothetical protein
LKHRLYTCEYYIGGERFGIVSGNTPDDDSVAGFEVTDGNLRNLLKHVR